MHVNQLRGILTMNVGTRLALHPGAQDASPSINPGPGPPATEPPVPGLGLTPTVSSRIVAVTITTGPIITVNPHVGKPRPGWDAATKPVRGHIQAHSLALRLRRWGSDGGAEPPRRPH